MEIKYFMCIIIAIKVEKGKDIWTTTITTEPFICDSYNLEQAVEVAEERKKRYFPNEEEFISTKIEVIELPGDQLRSLVCRETNQIEAITTVPEFIM